MISLENITYHINGSILLEPPSFTALPGSIVKIAGHNGAGKTTFLRILAGIIQPKSGDVIHAQKYVNYIGHHLGIKDDFTPMEQLLF